jgi:hypothetical protein
MARRTFKVIDVVKILAHWYAGRSKKHVARSLGVDRSTVANYVAPAIAAGLVPGGPPVTDEQWRAMVREWFLGLAGTRLVRPTWPAASGWSGRCRPAVMLDAVGLMLWFGPWVVALPGHLWCPHAPVVQAVLELGA